MSLSKSLSKLNSTSKPRHQTALSRQMPYITSILSKASDGLEPSDAISACASLIWQRFFNLMTLPSGLSNTFNP